MTAEFEARLRVMTKIRKLKALAHENENEHEARAALKQAMVLADKHGIDLDTIKFDPKAAVSLEEAMHQASAAFSRMAGAVGRAQGGEDDEDYSKYAERKPAPPVPLGDIDDDVPF